MLSALVALTVGTLQLVSLPALELRAPKGCAKQEAVLKSEYSKLVPNLWKVLDQTPSSAKQVVVNLVAVSSGLIVKQGQMTLGVAFGGFPTKRYGMDEQLCEAALLASGSDLGEPLWGPGLKKFVCIEAVRRSGYFNEAFEDTERRYKAALKFDPKFLHANLAATKGVPEAVREGKGIWLLQQLTVRYPTDFVIHYFRARRRLAPAGKPYTADDVAAVASNAAGSDQFAWMRQHGIDVKKQRSKIPVP